jgi:type IV pilus assembly protein PilB
MGTANGAPEPDEGSWWRRLLKKLFPPPPPIRPSFLKQDQYEEAQKVQQQTGQDISRVLVSLNMVGEREVLTAQAQEMGMGFVDLDRIRVAPEARDSLSKDLVRQFACVPVKREGQTLWVAVSNPSTLGVLEDLRREVGCRVIPVLALPEAIEEAIQKYYGGPA